MKSEENIALIKQELSDFKIDLGSIKELLDVKVTTANKLKRSINPFLKFLPKV